MLDLLCIAMHGYMHRQSLKILGFAGCGLHQVVSEPEQLFLKVQVFLLIAYDDFRTDEF